MKIIDLKARWKVDIQDAEIQRNLIWKNEFKNELIESILSNQPIGAITLFDENGKQHLEIIDGKQRIYALEEFWDGKLSYQGKSLALLTEYQQEKFWNYELVIQQSKGSFADKVKLFNKINKNIVPLKPFELLRAQFYGGFILGLKDFVTQDKNITQIFKKESLRGEREMIILDILRHEKSIEEFLNEHKNDNFEDFKFEPKNIFTFISQVFKKPTINLKILIDLAKEYQKNKVDFLNQRDDLNNDIDYMLDSIHIEGWNKLAAYERILDHYVVKKDPKRLFTQDIKETLWFKDNAHICPLCLQTIDSIDKTEVDHKTAWIKGGKTNPENAQLTHIYCNRRKGAK